MTTPKDIDTFELELEARTKLCCALADKDEEIERLRKDRQTLLIEAKNWRDEIERLLQELAEARRLHASAVQDWRNACELMNKAERELAEAREWIESAPHLTGCFEYRGGKCGCGRDALIAAAKESGQ
jgi:cell division septum initiation protein DivIVA